MTSYIYLLFIIIYLFKFCNFVLYCKIILKEYLFLTIFNCKRTPSLLGEGCSSWDAANVLDCNTIVREFKLQSCYYAYFPTWERHEPSYPPPQLCATIFLLYGWIWHEITHEFWYDIIKKKQKKKTIKKQESILMELMTQRLKKAKFQRHFIY